MPCRSINAEFAVADQRRVGDGLRSSVMTALPWPVPAAIILLMGWRSFSLLLILLGVVLFAGGIYIEYRLRQEVGTGFHSFLAHFWHSSEIEEYRGCSAEFVIAGPVLAIVGVVLRVMTGRRRRGCR